MGNSGNYIEIDPDQCKGCRLCINTCPHHCIVIVSDINSMGFQFARFESDSCTACGLCFYICPEPGAILVFKDEKTGDMR
jgi:Pyruvate/2-oxoacid:ferredoxin oxidoreductase delta subunit